MRPELGTTAGGSNGAGFSRASSHSLPRRLLGDRPRPGGVDRVSSLSNALDRTADWITVFVGVGLSVRLTASVWIILVSFSESRRGQGPPQAELPFD